MESTQAFQDACCRGERMLFPNNGTRTKTSYSVSVVRKAVHLIRNPFDNIVARLHLAVKRRKRGDVPWNETAAVSLDLFSSFHSSPRDSYLAWCNYVDTRHAQALQTTHLISRDVKALMNKGSLPCHADWFRYVQWHNRAIELATERLNIPVHYLYYENYSTNYNETLQDLLEFLNLVPPAGGVVNTEPLPFQAGKTYVDMYSPDEIQAATRFVRAKATPACWNLLKRYFDNNVDTKQDDEQVQ
jgi:hypothetical protein